MVDVISYYFLYGNKRNGIVFIQNFIKARNVARHLYKRSTQLVLVVLRSFRYHAKKQPVIFQYRERVVIIKEHGREHRIDGTLKIQIHPGSIISLQVRIFGNPKIIFFEEWL